MLPDSQDNIYTSNYCEENIYLLIQRFLAQPEINKHWSVYAVFISNQTKTVTLLLLNPISFTEAAVHLTGRLMATESSYNQRQGSHLGLSCHSRTARIFG